MSGSEIKSISNGLKSGLPACLSQNRMVLGRSGIGKLACLRKPRTSGLG